MSDVLLTLHVDVPVPAGHAPAMTVDMVLALVRAALAASPHFAHAGVSLGRTVVVSPKT